MLVDFFTSSKASDESKIKTAKILCGLVCFLILVSNVWTISRWSESRGVYDDICYLRQAHLDSGLMAWTPIFPGMTITIWLQN